MEIRNAFVGILEKYLDDKLQEILTDPESKAELVNEVLEMELGYYEDEVIDAFMELATSEPYVSIQSAVAHLVWDQGVAGSIPACPINNLGRFA